MANKYGITEIDGSPSQETIDSYLNWCDNNPTKFSKDVQKFNKEAKEKVKKELEQIKKDAQKFMDKQIKPPIEDLKKKLTPLKPLVEPPSSLDACLTYCTDLANYFKDPYTKLIELMTWWPRYIAAVSSATSSLISRVESQLAAIQSDPTGEKQTPDTTSDSSK